MRILFLVFSLILAKTVRANVMDLNELVPTHLEDASPVDDKETIYQMSGKFERDQPDVFTFRPDIRYGLNKRTQLEVMADINSGGDESGSGETRASVLYQVNESDTAFPILSMNPFVAFPTGKHNEGIDPGVKLLLTSTMNGTAKKPETQLHLNFQIQHNSSRQSQERSDEISYAAGFSRLLTSKLSLVADILFNEDEDKLGRNDLVEAGLHQQLSERLYLSYGAGKGISSASPDWSGILSLEFKI